MRYKSMSVALSAKQASLRLIERLDENVSFEEIMYELHILQKIKQGVQDVEAGNTVSHEQAKEKLKKWLS